MHVLIATAGSAGDVYPFIAIGQALARRGHVVELMGAPPFGTAVRGAGLGFHAVGAPGEFERIVAAPDLWHPRRGFALIAREAVAHLPAALEQTRALLRPDTLLVGGTLAWNIRLAQELSGRPAATVHLSPSCILSGDAPPLLPGLGWLQRLPPAAARAILAAVERHGVDPLIAPGLNRLRAALGLAPVDRVIGRWLNSPDAVIGAWPDWFGPRQADWPAAAATSGFPFWQRPDPDAGEGRVAPTIGAPLRRFLEAGAPPVGITPGSAMAHGRDFLASALAACEALGRRALVVTPYADQLPSRLPPGTHHARYVPFEWLVPRLAALVHHGGIGTCAQALRAGVPQGVAPFAHDQFDNAARVRRLGVGASVRPHAGPRAWTTALRTLLGDPAISAACARVRERLATGGDAAERIADRLEHVAACHEAGTPSTGRR